MFCKDSGVGSWELGVGTWSVGRNRNNSSSIWQAVESNRFVIFSCVAKLNMPPICPAPHSHICLCGAPFSVYRYRSWAEQIPRSKSGMFQGWVPGFRNEWMNEWAHMWVWMRWGRGCVVLSLLESSQPVTGKNIHYLVKKSTKKISLDYIILILSIYTFLQPYSLFKAANSLAYFLACSLFQHIFQREFLSIRPLVVFFFNCSISWSLISLFYIKTRIL